MRRVPDPENSRWNHMALLLHPGSPTAQGIWMEDYKFLAAYKLKPSVRGGLSNGDFPYIVSNGTNID